MKSKTLHFLIISLLFLSIVQSVSAEDTLKPILEDIYTIIKKLVNVTQQIVDKILEILDGAFPGLETSVENLKALFLSSPVLEWFPVLKEFLWIFYLAAFFAILAIIAKVWSISKRLIINTITGNILLLLLIHYFGVEIEVTVIALILVELFGVPGVLFVLIAHYLGIPL